MARMTPMIGTYGGSIPRLLVPRDAALSWKTDKQWTTARTAAKMPFAPKGGAEEQPRYSTFTTKGAPGFAIHSDLGAVGFLPSPTGGLFVCWVDAQKKGTGELPTEKLGKVASGLSAKRWRPSPLTVKGVGKHVLAYRPFDKADLGFDWLELELAPGDYAVHTVTPHKTPLGTLGFVRLTRGGREPSAPAIEKATAAERARDRDLAKRAKALPRAETDGGPLICMQEAVAKKWTGGDGKDYDRACSGKAMFHLLEVGGTQAIVLGYPNGTYWIELEKGRGLLVQALAMNSAAQLLELALTTADVKGYKKLGIIDIGTGKLRIQAALSPGKAPDQAVARLTLPKGRYTVEHLPRTVSSSSAVCAVVRLVCASESDRG